MENVSDLTVYYEEEGEVIIDELDKEVLQKAGAWVVVLFRYRERNRKTAEFGDPKVGLRRYQKLKGVYKKRDAVNLSRASTIKLRDCLSGWLEEGLLGDDSDDE